MFARQIRPRKWKTLIEIFLHATSEPYHYLFLDFTQECPEELRFRSNILGTPINIYKIN